MEKMYNDVKKEIRSLLLTYPKGVCLHEFTKTYNNLLGQKLPSRMLGFSSDIEFLKSMTDVVHVSINEIGKILLTGIANESTEHIQKLVSRQVNKTNNKSNKNKHKSRQPFRLPTGRKPTPFVPGPLRAEIIQLTTMYPDGITLSAFVLAYYKKYNKYLPLQRGLETLEDMISTMSDLEIKTVRGDKKIFLKNFQNKPIWYTDRMSQQNQGSRYTEGNKNQLNEQKNSSSFDKSGVPEAVKTNFQLVLDKCPEGILAVHFPVLYEKLTGKPFDLLELGYNSILELVDALPLIFKRMIDSANDRDWIIFPATSAVTHINQGKRISKTTPENACATRKKHPSFKFNETLPPDVVSPLMQYVPPMLPRDINIDSYLPVFVSAVVSPALFWFQVQTDEAIETLENLEKELMNFYDNSSEKYKMLDKDIVIGATCVTYFQEDQQWYRTVIKSIPSKDLVNVCFVDFGSRENVSKKYLYYVNSKFLDCPAQAFKAKLSSVKPVKNTWDSHSKQRFIELCESASLMAYLNPIDKDTFSIHLCDTSGEQDLHINDILIAEGYAEFIAENQSSDMVYSIVDKKQHVNNECATLVASPRIVSPVVNGSSMHSSSVYHPIQASSALEKNSLTDSDKMPSERKLSSRTEREFSDSEVTNCTAEKCAKRYIKHVQLCEDNQIHIINFNNKPYTTPGSLYRLFWKDKDAAYLKERLMYKEIHVPSLNILKHDNIELFKQCEWYKLPDLEVNSLLLTLYPLEWAFKLLNIFGHPSICLRLLIQNEIKTFDPVSPVWMEFTDFQEMGEIEEKFNKLCLYDLKAKYEAQKIKRLKLLQKNSDVSEIKRIEHLLFIIEKRIEYISSICLQYSSCS